MRGTLMRPDMYSISSFHSWNSSGRPTTMLAILAPGTGSHQDQDSQDVLLTRRPLM